MTGLEAGYRPLWSAVSPALNMGQKQIMWLTDFDLDEPLTCDVVAETVGARRSLVVRLAIRKA